MPGLPIRQDDGDMALMTRDENGNTARPPRQENGNTELSPRQENGNMEPPPRPENWRNMFNMIYHGWLRRHMEVDCQEHAVLPDELIQYVPVPLLNYRPVPGPLYFQSEETINGRPYLLQLEKAPFSYYIHKLTVRCLPISNLGIIVYYSNVAFSAGIMCGVYRFVCKVSQNYQYLVSYEVTRVASINDI